MFGLLKANVTTRVFYKVGTTYKLHVQLMLLESIIYNDEFNTVVKFCFFQMDYRGPSHNTKICMKSPQLVQFCVKKIHLPISNLTSI